MYYGTAVAGRTRSRKALTQERDLEKKNQSKKRHRAEEIMSDYSSEEGLLEGSEFDDDVVIIGEHDVNAVPVDDVHVLVIDESDDDDISMNDAVSLTGEPAYEGSPSEKEVEDSERNNSSVERSQAGFGLVRKKVSCTNTPTKENDVPVRGCVAQRTRSHFSSKLGKSKSKLGTISNPLCVDEEEQEFESLSEHCDTGDNSDEVSHTRRRTKVTTKKSGSYGGTRNRIVDDNLCKLFNGKCSSESYEGNISSDESQGLDCKQKAQKRNRGRKKQKANSKDFDALKILQESLCVDEEVPLEKMASSIDEEGNLKGTETCMPLKFNFGTKESEAPEKSELEKELDQLWAEMDECQRASEEDSGQKIAQKRNDQTDLDQLWAKMDECQHASEEDSGQVENDHAYDPCPEDKVSRATLCQQGKHLITYNEEIGLTCRYCSHVSLEIKYCDPPFSKNPFGKSSRKNYCTLDNADHPPSDDLQHQILDCDDDPSGHDSYISRGTVWDIIPGVKTSMFPHQREAFEFLWMNLAGGIVLDKLEGHLDFSGGSGCIISHAPGTGKTRLTIVFLQTFMKLYPTCRPMIIAPKSMLLTWEEEFEKWKVGVPFHNLSSSEYSGKESEEAMILLRQPGRHVHCKNSVRVVKLYSWKKERSILGISYNLFKLLFQKESVDAVIKKALLELPGLLVLDEGHTPRNANSLIWDALSEIKTKRRIILSGTPFQNNFVELNNTISLAKPKIAEWNSSGYRVKPFDEKRGCRRNETRDNLADLFYLYHKVKTDREKDKIVDEIRDMIKPFVHVHKGTVLQESLPGLRELVVRLKPSQLQKDLLGHIQMMRKTKGNHQRKEGTLELDHWESLITVHPSLLPVAEDKRLETMKWYPEDGVKTKFLMELIRLSELMNEKVLVFSQFLKPLVFLMKQLKSHYSWKEGREMLLMHGKLDAGTRQDLIKAFNDPKSKARVLLASTRACFEGINLVGASRVVLLDIVWNPSVDRQAVSRAYRLGQKKVVYTYRLITSGSRDEQKCRRQAEKDQLSEMVFFCPDGVGQQQKIASADLEDKVFQKMVHNENFRHIFEDFHFYWRSS